MKLAHSMKVLGLIVAFMAVLTVAAPGYAWTHDHDFGRNHYTGYHHYYGGSDYYRHHYGWSHGYDYAGYYHPIYRPYYYEPYVSPGFGFILPGFSVYVGP